MCKYVTGTVAPANQLKRGGLIVTVSLEPGRTFTYWLHCADAGSGI